MSKEVFSGPFPLRVVDRLLYYWEVKDSFAMRLGAMLLTSAAITTGIGEYFDSNSTVHPVTLPHEAQVIKDAPDPSDYGSITTKVPAAEAAQVDCGGVGQPLFDGANTRVLVVEQAGQTIIRCEFNEAYSEDTPIRYRPLMTK